MSRSLSSFHKFLLILIGITVFSSFGTNLFLDILGLPLALPEVCFLVLFPLLKSDFIGVKFDKRTFILLSIVWILLLLLSILVGRYQLHFVLSNARGWLYLILFYALACKSSPLPDNVVAYICLGSIIGWVMATLFSVTLMLSDGEFVGTNGNLLVIPLFIAITYKNKSYGLLGIGLLLLIVVSVLSGVRRCLFVTLLSLFLIYIIAGFTSIWKVFRTVSLWAVAIFILSLLYSQLQSMVYDISPMLYHRTFGRFEEVDDSDEGRLGMINNLFDNAQFIFPQGFYSSRTLEDETGGFIDLPISGIFYIFGSPLTLLMLFIISIWMIRVVRRYFKAMPGSVLAVITSVLIIYTMLFFEGSFVAVLYCTPITGYILGLLRYYSHNSYNAKWKTQ